MLKSVLFLVVILAGALVIGACASPQAPAAAPAAGGQPVVAVGTAPNPPTSNGQTELQIDVKDSAGNPLDGVEVTVLADMMGHSMGLMQGQASEQGNGRYATFVPFNMAGDWKVTVEVRREGELLIRQDFVLPVQ
jgi:ABC-type nitrate/sulfonate/bicarbonate transport system substrate-binding protein